MRLRENIGFVSTASFCGVIGTVFAIVFAVAFAIALAIDAAHALIAVAFR